MSQNTEIDHVLPEMTVYVLRALRQAGIHTIRELCSMTDEQILAVPGLKIRHLREIKSVIDHNKLLIKQIVKCVPKGKLFYCLFGQPISVVPYGEHRRYFYHRHPGFKTLPFTVVIW